MAHLVYDFLETDGGAVLDIEDEYMFGRALLVAPITAEGEWGREIYLPRGRWLDLWTGEPFEGGRRITRRVRPGQDTRLCAPRLGAAGEPQPRHVHGHHRRRGERERRGGGI